MPDKVDYVYGNKGNDTLYGNKGDDTFVCTKGFDVIKDFWGLDGDKISVASVANTVISEKDGSTSSPLVVVSYYLKALLVSSLMSPSI